MIVIYEGNDEVWICEKYNEKKLLKEHFGKKHGRNIKDYARAETDDIMTVYTHARINVEGNIQWDEDIENNKKPI